MDSPASIRASYRTEISELKKDLSAALKRAEDAERERDRLHAGLSAIVHCQSHLSRTEVREAAAELLETTRAIWFGGDQSPLAAAVASLRIDLTVALKRAEDAERERNIATAKTAIALGVGDGSGQLFVYGDYDSIKAAQRGIFEKEKLRADLAAAIKRAKDAERERKEQYVRCVEQIGKQLVLTSDLAAANATIAKLHERLEDNYVFDSVGTRIEVEPGSVPDGIECRNDTIKLLNEQIEHYNATIAKLRADVGPCGCVDGCEQEPGSGPSKDRRRPQGDRAMTNKQREAHEALVSEIAYEIMKAPHKFIEYSIWEMHCARRIAALIAERLSDVTEEMAEGGNVLVSHGCGELDNTFLAMLRASALFPGDQT